MSTTDSRKLHKTPMPVGNPLNNVCIAEALVVSNVLLVAWGRLHPSLFWREREVRALLRNSNRPPTYALALNKDGAPAHPLYLPISAPLLEFRP